MAEVASTIENDLTRLQVYQSPNVTGLPLAVRFLAHLRCESADRGDSP